MESKWSCIACSSDNDPSLNSCEVCEEPRPVQAPMGTEQHQPIKISPRKPIQLFSNDSGYINLIQKSLARLANNFDPNKKTIIILAAGLLGTGKSTWLSELIYEFERPYFEFTGYFDIGQTQETQTEGIWVYPYPLTIPNVEDTQYMLLDMEGMDGIKEGESEETKSSLIKLYTLGLMLASVFTIHTNFRIDNSTIESLKQAFVILKQLNREIQIEPPKIWILVKDCEEFKTHDGINGKTFIREKCRIEDEVLNLIEISGRPTPPENFLNALKVPGTSNVFKMLDESPLSKFNQNFIKLVITAPKKRPGLVTNMTISDFESYVKELGRFINCEEHHVLFKASLEKTYYELMQPLKNDLLGAYNEKARYLASNYSVEKSLDEFKMEIKTLREEFKGQLKERSQKVIMTDVDKIEVFKNVLRQFIISLNNEEAQQAFIIRKMEHASLKDKEELKTKIKDLEEDTAKRQIALQNLQTKLEAKEQETESKIDSLKKELELKASEYQQSIARLNMENAQEISRLTTQVWRLKTDFENLLNENDDDDDDDNDNDNDSWFCERYNKRNRRYCGNVAGHGGLCNFTRYGP